MSQVLAGDIEAIVLHRIATARRVFCFLDLDGMLASLTSTPDFFDPLRDTPILLRQLALAPGTGVALLTGRRISELRRQFAVPNGYYVGVHSLEVSGSGRVVEISGEAAAVQSMMPAIERHLDDTLGARLGIVIEEKGIAQAYHYRSATRVDRAATCTAVPAAGASFQRSGLPIDGTDRHAVVELLSIGVTKGIASCALLSMHALSTLPVYIGDHASDEDTFNALPAHAITIRVGPPSRPTAASYRVNGPRGLLRLLYAVLRCRHAGANTPDLADWRN